MDEIETFVEGMTLDEFKVDRRTFPRISERKSQEMSRNI